MTREDIIRMADEAGIFMESDTDHWYYELGRFAALVAAAVRKDADYRLGLLIQEEREAIAQSLDKQADLAADDIDRQWAQEMAAAVRARGQS